MAAIAQIVSGIGGSTVLDLNDTSSGGQLLGDRSQIELADSDAVDAALGRWEASTAPIQVGTRKITLPVTLVGSSVDNLGTKVAQLNQAVQVPWWLRVRRHGGTLDSWLRCYPAIPRITGQVTASSAGHIATGTITADTEPYAYGARVDAGPFTVTQDTSVSTACYCDITGVTGDTLTPAVIRTATTGMMSAAQATLLAVRRHGTPSSLPAMFLQGETATGSTTGANVTVATTSNAAYCGSSANRVTFASGFVVNGGTGILTWATLSAFTGQEMPGTYRVLARVTRSSATDSYRVTASIGPALIGAATVVGAAGAQTTMVVDAGLMQLPVGFYPQLGAPGALLGSAAPVNLKLIVEKLAGGAGTLDVDWVALIPADEDSGVVYNAGADVGATLTLDGYTNTAFLHTADPVTGSTPTSSSAGDHTTTYVGGVPRLAPGANRLWLVTGMVQARTSGTPAITVSPVINVSYWPRYTWLR